MSHEVLSLSEAGRRLSIDRKTVGHIAMRLGFRYKPVPSTPFANGLTVQEVEIIRDRLKPIESAPVAASA